jgi:hypothetical protein
MSFRDAEDRALRNTVVVWLATVGWVIAFLEAAVIVLLWVVTRK